MKKFLITLLILAVIGVAGFFLGWAQLSVPPGQYGVVNSKTHGIDPEIVRSGEFRWIWYKLIPTNVQIAVFSIEQNKFPINFNSSLPSGDRYASFAGLTDASFSWDMRGEISFSIDPGSLVSIASRYNITDQDGLDSYLRDIAQDIEVLLLRSLSSAADDNLRIETILSGSMDTETEREIRDRFPEIRGFSLVIHSAKYPDFVLYRQLRLLYEDFLARQREYLTSAFGRRAESRIETQFRFEELERYGDLLTRYPVLMDYLTMENIINSD